MTIQDDAIGSTPELLLAATAEQFARLGYEEAHLASIAEDAGLTTGAFYRHFASKQIAFDLLYNTMVDDMTAALARATDLRTACLAWLDVSEQHVGAVRASDDLVLIAPEVRDRRKWTTDVWAAMLTVHLPDQPSRARAQALAEILTMSLDFLAFTRRMGWSRHTAEELADALVELVVGGLYRGVSVDGEGRRLDEPPTPPSPPVTVPSRVEWTVAPGRMDPRSPRARAQRDAILDAAAEVFARSGFSGASIGQIAGEASISAATAYRYFVDKRDVFVCLLARAEQSLLAASLFPMGADGRLEIRGPARSFLAMRNAHRAVYTIWRELLDRDEELREAWIAIHADFHAAITKVVRKGQQAGLIPAGLEPSATAEVVDAFFEGLGRTRGDLGWIDQVSDDEVVALLSQLVGREPIGGL